MSERGSRMQRFAIVGMKHRGTVELLASLPPDEPMSLVREPDNKFDPDAVQVWARGRHIGYVPKTQNAVLARFIDAVGKPTAIMGMDAGGANIEFAKGKSVDARLHLGSNTYPLVEIV